MFSAFSFYLNLFKTLIDTITSSDHELFIRLYDILNVFAQNMAHTINAVILTRNSSLFMSNFLSLLYRIKKQ